MSVIDKTFYELTKKSKSRKLEVLSSSSDADGDYDDYNDDDKTKTLPKKRPRKVNHKYSSESYENLDFLNLTKPTNGLSQVYLIVFQGKFLRSNFFCMKHSYKILFITTFDIIYFFYNKNFFIEYVI